jgi:hypothetical protein
MPDLVQWFTALRYDSGTGSDPLFPVIGGQAGAGWPPDVNGDVGPTYYIEAVNDAYAVFNKFGGPLVAFTENALWLGGGGASPCNGNSRGDPVVLYDALADRWILTHFAFAPAGVSPFYECIAVSRTGDPITGGWWLYAIRMDTGASGQPPVGTLNDYPKFGIWSDCLYMAANGFSEPGGSFAGTMFASFSRADMYAGRPLTAALGFIANTQDPSTMIPSTLLGTSAGSQPPAGTPNYFVSQSLVSFELEVRKFTAGPNCGGGGTLSDPVRVSQATYSPASGALVPQAGTSVLLDSLGHRLMQKVPYRRIGSTESLWVTHTVRSGATIAPQWAQLDVTGGLIATAPVQQQIYVPDSILYRWMPSLAVDRQGNMAMGYSVSNATNYPFVATSGRLAGDPPNNLPQTERQFLIGGGSQTNGQSRWGDYASMSIDPSDDCTFWYIGEYYGNEYDGSRGDWYTWIAAFKYPSCGPTPAPTLVTTAVSGISVGSATLGGIINPNGVAANAYFQWGQTVTYGATTPVQDAGAGSSSVPYNATITGLSCGTTYHFQAVGSNSGNIEYGGDQSFTTSACPPTVMTSSAGSISSTSATLGGTVNPNGGETTAYFQWGPTTAYGATTPAQGVGSGTAIVPLSASLTGLACASPYHFRAVASNPGGTGHGDDQTFSTNACPASLYTESPCRILDTRPNPLPGNTVYEVAVANHCGIPSTAKAVAVNVTVVGASSNGYLTVWPAQTARPNTATVTFVAGAVRSNNAILALAPSASGSAGALWVEFGGSGGVNVILDVSGYFE